MKQVVSISIGSSKRNHRVTTCLFGQEFSVERIGTDGDIDRAVQLMSELDGKCDAIGVGGLTFYVMAGGRRHYFRDAKRVMSACKKTPIVDGSGLKHILERHVVRYVHENVMNLTKKPVLVASALDRMGMAQGFFDVGSDVVLGDFMFSLGLSIPLKSLSSVTFLGSIILPVATKMPYHWFYPTGQEQERRVDRFGSYYDAAEVIAGDYLYLNRYMPASMANKIVVTNTVTAADVAELKTRKAAALVTCTPEMQGRSFGTNVIEAMILAAAGKKAGELTAKDYESFITGDEFKPRVEWLSPI